MSREWVVCHRPTDGAVDLCPDCHEEATFVVVVNPAGQGMTALMCPSCNGAFPIVVQVQR